MRSDLDSFLNPNPTPRGFRCGESHSVLNERHRFRENLARHENGIGGSGGSPSPAVEDVRFREEGIEEAGVRDLHPLTRTGSGRAARSPAGPRPRTSEASSGPTVRSRAVGSVRPARRLLRRFPPTRGPSCEPGGLDHFPIVEPWRTCRHMMYTHSSFNPCGEVGESGTTTDRRANLLMRKDHAGCPSWPPRPLPPCGGTATSSCCGSGPSAQGPGGQLTGSPIPWLACTV